jgi:uncharacterized protein YjbI with pentapeptide repeats
MPCSYKFENKERRVVLDCAFGYLEGDLSKVNEDKSFCPFHLPAASKSDFSTDQINKFNDLVLERIKALAKDQEIIDFKGTVFPGDIHFGRLFEGTKAPELDFRNCTFMGKVSFEGVIFEKRVTFEWSTFERQTNFSRAQFETWGDFRRTKFKDDTDFSDTLFKGWGHFTNAEFVRSVSFDSVHFSSDADFTSSEFDRGSFTGWEDFTAAGLSASAKFREIPLFGLADFATAKFLRAFFRQCIFDCKVDFNLSVFRQYAYFNATKFNESAYFIESKFGFPARFRDAEFIEPPKFHNAELHPDTDFTNTTFPTEPPSEDSARAYRVLKLAMEETRARDDEANFHAYELEIRRKLDSTSLPVKLLSFFYKIGSDYGRKVGRPFLVLAFTILAFGFIYLCLTDQIHLTNFRNSLQFSFLQVVRPFWVTIPGAEASYGGWTKLMMCNHPILLRTLAFIQSIICLGSLTLFILAVRRKFRL